MKYQSCDFHRYFISKKFLGNIDNELFFGLFFCWGGGTFFISHFCKASKLPYIHVWYVKARDQIRGASQSAILQIKITEKLRD